MLHSVTMFWNKAGAGTAPSTRAIVKSCGEVHPDTCWVEIVGPSSPTTIVIFVDGLGAANRVADLINELIGSETKPAAIAANANGDAS
jgi:hypothetical protein